MYIQTSKEDLSSGVTEHFILLQLTRMKAWKTPSGVVKTLFEARERYKINRKFVTYYVRYTGDKGSVDPFFPIFGTS